ncbi:MAG: cytochrome c [Pseudomonadales bacterium]|nr:cytochrome c [Pseudomonadales bacterium]NIX09003.1 cytochrome c [Pseudomonadales bacterium]
MTRFLNVLGLALTVSAVAGCSERPADGPAAVRADDAPGSLQSPPAGQATYAMACASCHDTGVAGAPRIGDEETWSNRSPLWTAVLAEHAEDGYLNMPAMGGAEDLSERAVQDAVEYMLSATFPEAPPAD